MIEGPEAQSLENDIGQIAAGNIPNGWQVVPSSPHARVYRHAGKAAYFKEFLPRSQFDIVKSWLRGDRSIRARLRSVQLAELGFNTPRPLAWGLFKRHRGFLVTEGVAAIGVTDWLRGEQAADTGKRRKLLLALGDVIGCLHRSGIVHGDLRTSNVLVANNSPTFTFYFIDNERNSRYPEIPLKLVKKNLVQLDMLPPADLSRSDRTAGADRRRAHAGAATPGSQGTSVKGAGQ
jgi:hypothetical protein